MAKDQAEQELQYHGNEDLLTLDSPEALDIHAMFLHGIDLFVKDPPEIDLTLDHCLAFHPSMAPFHPNLPNTRWVKDHGTTLYVAVGAGSENYRAKIAFDSALTTSTREFSLCRAGHYLTTLAVITNTLFGAHPEELTPPFFSYD